MWGGGVTTENQTTITITMPTIGTYSQVAEYLQLARATVYRMTCRKQFKPGIYLGQGRFSMSRLRECIEAGSYLHQPWKRAK
jgi:predicted DNA-binding transcriptional regulator AlpA